MRAAALLAALIVLAVALRDVDFARSIALVRDLGASALWIPLPYFSALCLDTVGWKSVLARLKAWVSFPALLSVRIVSEALLMTMLAGPVFAETAMPYLLDRRHGVPWAVSIASLAARKRFILLANGLYLLIGLLLGGALLAELSARVIGVRGLPWLILAAGLILVAGSLAGGELLARGRIAERLHGGLTRLPFSALRQWLGAAREGFRDTDRALLQSMRLSLPFSARVAPLYLCAWLLEGFETYLILRLLSVPIDFGQALAIEVVLALVRSLAFLVPAGLGVQDVGYVLFLRALQVPEASEVGVAFVLLKRTKELLFITLGYLFLFATGGGPRAVREVAIEAKQQPR